MPTKSNESLVCVGEDVADTEDADDLEEWPRDHSDAAGEAVDEIDSDGVCRDCAILF